MFNSWQRSQITFYGSRRASKNSTDCTRHCCEHASNTSKLAGIRSGVLGDPFGSCPRHEKLPPKPSLLILNLFSDFPYPVWFFQKPTFFHSASQPSPRRCAVSCVSLLSIAARKTINTIPLHLPTFHLLCYVADTEAAATLAPLQENPLLPYSFDRRGSMVGYAHCLVAGLVSSGQANV